MLQSARDFRPGSGPVKTLAVLAALVLPQQAQPAPSPAEGQLSIQFQMHLETSKIAAQPMIAEDAPYVVTDVELNGHRMPALLDTGAEFTAVDASVAREIGLKPSAPFETNAIGGKATLLRTNIDTLVAGAFTRSGGWVAVADFGEIQQHLKQPVSVILGADFLSQIAVAINRDKQSLIFLPSGAHLTGSYTAVPLHIRQPGNHFMSELSINGRALSVRVDTGSDDELRLGDSKWGSIVPSDTRTTTLAGFGLGGITMDTIARLNTPTIGGMPVGDVVAVKSSTGVDSDEDGVVAMGLLSRWNLFLDPRAGVMAISKPEKPTPPRRETMVGIQGPPTDDGITIIHVMAHSPAEAAGLKAGDRICTVDGATVRAAWRGTPKNEWMAGPENKTVVLGRCGGGAVRITLRRFY